jgi:hypothetical protein
MELGQRIVLKILYGLKNILQIYTYQFGSNFCFETFPKQQFTLLWNVNVCNLLVKVVPLSLYKFKSWKMNLKGYKLQLWSKK